MEPKAKFADCSNCPLRDKRFVPSNLPANTEWVFIGEAPGFNETLKGEPFIGNSGKILRGAIAEAELNNPGFTNICLCRPDDNADPPQEAIDACKPRLLHELGQLKNVKGLVTLGRWSAIAMVDELGPDFKITEVHGQRFVNPDTDLPITVLYHPAYLLHGAWGRHDEFKHAVKAINQKQEKLNVTWEITDAFDVLDKASTLSNPIIVYDIETTSLDNQLGEILEIGFTWDGHHVYIVPWLGIDILAKSQLDILFDKDAKWYGQNLKFDNKYLRRNGVQPPKNYRDTMLLHYALDENRGTHGLKLLGQRYLGVPNWERGIEQYIVQAKRIRAKNVDHDKFAPLKPIPDYRNQFEAYGYANIPDEVRREYLAYDCAYNWQLIAPLELAVDNEHKGTELVDNILMPLSYITEDIDYTGIRVDRPLAEQLTEEIWNEQQWLMIKMQDMIGNRKFNPGSTVQLAHVLFDEFKLPVTKRSEKTGKPSTDKDVIADIKSRFAFQGGDPKHIQFLNWLLEYRQAGKVVGTYLKNILESLDENDYSHPDLAIHGTTTGRLTDKMWLLIPRTGTNRFTEKLRYLVLPDPGHVLLHIDYDQAELRVVTVEARDEIYQSVFLVGGDPHAATADDLFGPGWRDLPPDQAKEKRTHAKTVNFGILYGQGARGMAESAGVPVNVAQAWLARYWATHTAIKDWADGIRHQVHTSGIVETHFGRKRRYTLIPNDKAAADIEREAVNFPIQSTAADLLYLSAIEASKRPDMPRLILLNHDAMLLSCPPGRAESVLAELQEIMARVPREQYTTYVPFTADASYGQSWGDCK